MSSNEFSQTVKNYRMYDEFAGLWPLVSSPEDYRYEAGLWRDALREKLGPGRHRILEFGVGGGDNLFHLKCDFQATAVDISAKMLENSVKQNPEVEHLVGDMRTFRIGRKFDAVIIHDAISYLLTEADLKATFTTASEHLRPGGVFITAPDWYVETYKKPATFHGIKKLDGVELTFIQWENDPDPRDTTMECLMLYVIRENGHMRVEDDLHITGIFPLGTWERLLRQAGFALDKKPYPVHKDGRDAYLLVCTKPAG